MRSFWQLFWWTSNTAKTSNAPVNPVAKPVLDLTSKPVELVNQSSEPELANYLKNIHLPEDSTDICNLRQRLKNEVAASGLPADQAIIAMLEEQEYQANKTILTRAIKEYIECGSGDSLISIRDTDRSQLPYILSDVFIESDSAKRVIILELATKFNMALYNFFYKKLIDIDEALVNKFFKNLNKEILLDNLKAALPAPLQLHQQAIAALFAGRSDALELTQDLFKLYEDTHCNLIPRVIFEMSKIDVLKESPLQTSRKLYAKINGDFDQVLSLFESFNRDFPGLAARFFLPIIRESDSVPGFQQAVHYYAKSSKDPFLSLKEVLLNLSDVDNIASVVAALSGIHNPKAFQTINEAVIEQSLLKKDKLILFALLKLQCFSEKVDYRERDVLRINNISEILHSLLAHHELFINDLNDLQNKDYDSEKFLLFSGDIYEALLNKIFLGVNSLVDWLEQEVQERKGDLSKSILARNVLAILNHCDWKLAQRNNVVNSAMMSEDKYQTLLQILGIKNEPGQLGSQTTLV